jgi:hypothetical protein
VDPAVANLLGLARAALGRGDLRGGLRRSFEAGRTANARGDEAGLEAVVALALEVQEMSEGRRRKEAAFQVDYFRQCLEHPDTARRGSLLDMVLGFRPKAKPRPLKRCPQCAEDVRAEAAVCRFCGHSFETREPSS